MLFSSNPQSTRHQPYTGSVLCFYCHSLSLHLSRTCHSRSLNKPHNSLSCIILSARQMLRGGGGGEGMASQAWDSPLSTLGLWWPVPLQCFNSSPAGRVNKDTAGDGSAPVKTDAAGTSFCCLPPRSSSSSLSIRRTWSSGQQSEPPRSAPGKPSRRLGGHGGGAGGRRGASDSGPAVQSE